MNSQLSAVQRARQHAEYNQELSNLENQDDDLSFQSEMGLDTICDIDQSTKKYHNDNNHSPLSASHQQHITISEDDDIQFEANIDNFGDDFDEDVVIENGMSDDNIDDDEPSQHNTVINVREITTNDQYQHTNNQHGQSSVTSPPQEGETQSVIPSIPNQDQYTNSTTIRLFSWLFSFTQHICPFGQSKPRAKAMTKKRGQSTKMFGYTNGNNFRVTGGNSSSEDLFDLEFSDDDITNYAATTALRLSTQTVLNSDVAIALKSTSNVQHTNISSSSKYNSPISKPPSKLPSIAVCSYETAAAANEQDHNKIDISELRLVSSHEVLAALEKDQERMNCRQEGVLVSSASSAGRSTSGSSVSPSSSSSAAATTSVPGEQKQPKNNYRPSYINNIGIEPAIEAYDATAWYSDSEFAFGGIPSSIASDAVAAYKNYDSIQSEETFDEPYVDPYGDESNQRLQFGSTQQIARPVNGESTTTKITNNTGVAGKPNGLLIAMQLQKPKLSNDSSFQFELLPLHERGGGGNGRSNLEPGDMSTWKTAVALPEHSDIEEHATNLSDLVRERKNQPMSHSQAMAEMVDDDTDEAILP